MLAGYCKTLLGSCSYRPPQSRVINHAASPWSSALLFVRVAEAVDRSSRGAMVVSHHDADLLAKTGPSNGLVGGNRQPAPSPTRFSRRKTRSVSQARFYPWPGRPSRLVVHDDRVAITATARQLIDQSFLRGGRGGGSSSLELPSCRVPAPSERTPDVRRVMRPRRSLARSLAPLQGDTTRMHAARAC